MEHTIHNDTRKRHAHMNVISVALILATFVGLGAAGLLLMGGHP